jgi:hypothetical protein
LSGANIIIMATTTPPTPTPSGYVEPRWHIAIEYLWKNKRKQIGQLAEVGDLREAVDLDSLLSKHDDRGLGFSAHANTGDIPKWCHSVFHIKRWRFHLTNCTPGDWAKWLTDNGY